tara:strand:- start:207 stop:1034 length:828 start_codon:yes stop_codon:yes gene_type:complete
MSRILKRPMFKMGGSTENSGIMDGMRQRYADAGKVEEVLKELDKRAPAPNFGRSQFLTEFGLNLLSTPPQGNIFQTGAIAARDPFARFQQNRAASAANRREIMASLLAQDREQAFEMDKLEKQLAAQKEIAGLKSQKDLAMDNFPDAGNPVVAKKLQVILDSPNAINAPGQIVPDGQNIVKTIQALNPDAGTVFALYSPLTGDVTKFVRVEKEKNNRVKLAEVDADGADLPGAEGDAPSEEEEFRGFPTYKQDPKPNIFKDLKPQEAFDIDEPQA